MLPILIHNLVSDLENRTSSLTNEEKIILSQFKDLEKWLIKSGTREKKLTSPAPKICPCCGRPL